MVRGMGPGRETADGRPPTLTAKDFEPLQIAPRNEVRGVSPEGLGVGLLRFVQISQRDVRAAEAIEGIGVFLEPIDDLQIQRDSIFPVSLEGRLARLLA